MKRELTCIICPLGCSLEAEIVDGRVVAVKGNTCKRGQAYAEEECVQPKRTVTTTVKTTDGRPVSCKTASPIPKEKIFEAMQAINAVRIELPVSIGDVIIEDLFGAKLVATENKK